MNKVEGKGGELGSKLLMDNQEVIRQKILE